MKNDRKILIPVIITLILIITMGATYAFFNYSQTGNTSSKLIAGDIWMNYRGVNNINIQDAMPGDDYDSSDPDNYFEFTITGTNNYSEKDIYYEIKLNKGVVPENKTEEDRIPDEYLKFRLVSVVNNVETEIFTNQTYDSITNKVIHIETIPKSTSTYNKTYRLYFVLSDEIIIGNTSNAIYDMESWSQAFASVRVDVSGDFTVKTLDTPSDSDTTAADYIISTYGTGGLVAVNSNGTLYNGSGTIREYRYSGPSVNNYVEFNNGEIWRIIGIFKNSAGEWNLKLMRNTMLTSAELPSSYTYSGTSYTIEDGTTGYVYWNNSGPINNNDWTTAGLQYYLNGTDGYFGTLSSGAQALVDTSYTYYLGNVTSYDDTADDTTISSYTSERGSTVCSSSVTEDSQNNNCNIWYGNKATWSKSTNSNANGIALLYPSDYGYSADSSYWSSPTLYNYDTGPKDTSWMYATANHTTYEWMLSPSSYYSGSAAYWYTSGCVDYSNVYHNNNGARPVLNLLSTAEIDTNHTGSSSDPYVVVE